MIPSYEAGGDPLRREVGAPLGQRALHEQNQKDEPHARAKALLRPHDGRGGSQVGLPSGGRSGAVASMYWAGGVGEVHFTFRFTFISRFVSETDQR